MVPTRQVRTIRRVVNHVIQKKNEEIDFFSGLSDEQKNVKPVKLLWLLLVTACSTICIYQITGRIRYYLSNPTVADVYTEILHSDNFPKILLCTRHTKQNENLIGERNVENGVCPQMRSDDYWKIINTTDTVKYVYFSTKGNFYVNASLESFNNYRGACAKVFTDHPLPISDPSLELHIVFNKKLVFLQVITTNFISEIREFITNLLTMSVKQKTLNNFDSSTQLRNGPVTSLVKLTVKYQKTTFVSTKTRPCVDPEENDNCIIECEQRYFATKITKCKYPFMSTANNLSYCGMPPYYMIFYNLVEKGYDIFWSNVCKCHRSCVAMDPDFKSELTKINKEAITVTMKSNEYETTEQKFSYDFISLLCDIGGNVSLFLGLSCLSFIQIAIQCGRCITIKKRAPKLPSKLFSKVSRIYINYCQTKILLQSRNNSNEKNKTIEKLLHLIKLLILCLSIYQVYQSIAYYFTYPVAIVIDHKESIYVSTRETVTSCLESVKINDMKENFAKKNNMSTDVVNLIDLLRAPSHFQNANDLWSAFSYYQVFESPFNLGGKRSPMVRITPTVTFLGNCTSVFPHGLCALHKNRDCIYKIFATPIGEPLNLKYFITLRCSWWYNFVYSRQEVIRVNTPRNPCVSSEEYFRCEQSCYQSKFMAKNVTCRLPHTQSLKLPTCVSFESARQTQQAYLEAYLSTNPFKECSCKVKCIEKRQPLELRTQQPHDFSYVLFNIKDNKIEVIEQVLSFEIIKMFCDIGSNLGSIAGISMISSFVIFENSWYILTYIQIRIM